MLNESMERALSAENPLVALKKLRAEVIEHISAITTRMRGTQSLNTRYSCYNFALSRIHTRDMLQEMLGERDKALQDGFFWRV